MSPPDQARPVRQGSHSVEVIVVTRRQATPSQHSLERLLKELSKRWAISGCDVKVRELPLVSRGVIRRILSLWWVRRLDCEVLHVFGDVQFVAPFAPKHSAVVLTVHDTHHIDTLSGIRRATYRLIWFKLPLRRAQLVTTVSDATRAELVRHFPEATDRTQSVPNPVLSEFLSPPVDEPVSDVLIVLQVGTKANKNLPTLAEAMSGLGMQLRVVGPVDGDLAAMLNSFAIDWSSVENISPDQIVEEYDRTNIVAVISTHEGFGMPVVEAMARSRAVVASDREPLRSLATQSGILVDPTCSGDVRAALVRLRDSPNLRSRLASHGRTTVGASDAQSTADRYHELHRLAWASKAGESAG